MNRFYLLFLLFMISCDLIPPSKDDMSHLYVNILVAEEEYKSDADSMKIVIDKLYKAYNIDEKKYLAELANYKYDEKTWDEFFTIAENYLDTLKSQEKKK